MRRTLTAVLTLFSMASFSQGAEWGMNYIFSMPRGPMQDNMRQAHGANFDFYYTPAAARYSVGMELSANGYGHDKTRQTYTFEDGSTAPMDIVVSNNYYNILLTGRHFLSQGKIQPFINAKIGYSIYATDLNIYDPNDADHCEPVDTDVLKRDGTFIATAGGGIRWEMLPKRSPGRFYLNLSANYTSGGQVNYMNVDAPTNSHSTHTSDVYAKFLNTQTQVIHEHHVGNVYTSVVEFIDFRFGVTMKIGPSKN